MLALEAAEPRPPGLQPLALVDDRPVEPGDEVVAEQAVRRRAHAAHDLVLAAAVGDRRLEAGGLQRVLDALVEQPEQLAVRVVDLGPQLGQARQAGGVAGVGGRGWRASIPTR